MDFDFEARVRILAWLQDPGSDPFPVPTCRPELFAMQVPGTTVYVGGCRTVGSKVYLVDAATLGDSDELPPTR